MDFSGDRLVERLHRLLVVLEDERALIGLELPPLAVYDISERRWLLAAGVPFETLKANPAPADCTAHFLIVVGADTIPVDSADTAVLLTRFVECARAKALVIGGDDQDRTGVISLED